MTAPRSLSLVEAAALLRVHKNTLAARARARIDTLEKIKFSLVSRKAEK